MPDDANGWTEDASADTAESRADFSAVRKKCQADASNANLTLETQDFDKASADIEKKWQRMQAAILNRAVFPAMQAA